MTLKDLLKSRMRKKNYNQSDFAKKLGISRQAVSDVLNKNITRCHLKTIQTYFNILGLKCNFLKDAVNQN